MDAGFQSQEYLASLVGLPRGSGATAHAYPRTVIPVSPQGKTESPRHRHVLEKMRLRYCASLVSYRWSGNRASHRRSSVARCKAGNRQEMRIAIKLT